MSVYKPLITAGAGEEQNISSWRYHVNSVVVEQNLFPPLSHWSDVSERSALLAVLLSLWIWQVVEVQEDGRVGELAAVRRQVQQLFGGARHRADVHVPHLLWGVQLQQLLFDLQILLNVPALVLELQDGLGVAIDGGDWGRHAGRERAPRQTMKHKQNQSSPALCV